MTVETMTRRAAAQAAWLGSLLAAQIGCVVPQATDPAPEPIGRPGVPYHFGTDTRSGSTGSNGADGSVVLIGAGDIGECGLPGASLTARQISLQLARDSTPTWVFTLGDNAYEFGREAEFENCYRPWKRFLHFTRPVPGNHDYKNGKWFGFLFGGNADPYFDYFDAFPDQAGARGDGWYRYRHGEWEVFALNTAKKGPIERDSRQWTWLEGELASRPSQCSIAYLHHPRFSASGHHGDNEQMRETWQLLADHGVDILMAGHEHDYQRFGPQTVDGQPDARGMRQFIVGSGGVALRRNPGTTAGTLEFRQFDQWGVLKLNLYPDRYQWQFFAADGSVLDSGQSECQNTRGTP